MGTSDAATYKNPTPTVDVIIELSAHPGKIVAILRRNAPVGLALPGGFVDEGEFLCDAAVREAKEETGLEVELLELFHAYSDPTRDARKHTVSTVFIGRAHGTPTASDDAAECVIAPAAELVDKLVFDHPTIIRDYLHYRATGQRPPVRR